MGNYILHDTDEAIYNHIKQSKGISEVKEEGSVFLFMYKREIEESLIPLFNGYVKLMNDNRSNEQLVESKLKELICSTRVFGDINNIQSCKLLNEDKRKNYLREVVREVVLGLNDKYSVNKFNLPIAKKQ